MISKVLLTVCVLVAVTSAVPAAGGWWPGPAGGWGAGGAAGGWGAGGTPGVWGIGPAGGWGVAAPGGPGVGGGNPWLPPWIASAPWMPQWSPCTTIGTSCKDCSTKLVCTKVGGMERACTDPTLPYCNLGECSATPSTECAPADAPTTTAA